jgi:putative heme-binding domain-containing protein
MCVRLLLCITLFHGSLLFAEPVDEIRRAKDAKIVETLLRLPGFDLNSKPEAKAAVLRHLTTLAGDEKYVELVETFSLAEAAPGLLEQALAKPDTTQGVQCARLLFKLGKPDGLKAAVLSNKDAEALPAIMVVGLVQNDQALSWLEPLVFETEHSVAIRVAAVNALGKLKKGEEHILKAAAEGKLPADLQFAAANVLLNSNYPEIKTAAAKYLQPPATADSKPLPPLPELVAMTGDAAAGKLVFSTKGTCAKCHVVNNEGKEVGPNLSEIGSKLSREAMFVSILDPSAGVSHNFETSLFAMESGQIVTGIVLSETNEQIVVKTADAIAVTLAKSEIEESKKLKSSLMPNNLQALMTAQELIDVVEYLTTLKKK